MLTAGITLTILADVGAGAWDALNVGLADVIGLSVGNWVIIIGIILIFVNALLVNQKPKLFSVLAIFLIGLLIDTWLSILTPVISSESTLGKYAVFLVGMCTIALGVTIYLKPQYPQNPIDMLMLSLHDRFGWNLLVAKTVGEVAALGLALLVGGPIGIGTLVITFGIGPLIQLFDPIVTRGFRRRPWYTANTH